MTSTFARLALVARSGRRRAARRRGAGAAPPRPRLRPRRHQPQHRLAGSSSRRCRASARAPRSASSSTGTKNGGFKKVEELMKIQGIGERSFLRLRPLVTVGSAEGRGQVAAVAEPGSRGRAARGVSPVAAGGLLAGRVPGGGRRRRRRCSSCRAGARPRRRHGRRRRGRALPRRRRGRGALRRRPPAARRGGALPRGRRPWLHVVADGDGDGVSRRRRRRGHRSGRPSRPIGSRITSRGRGSASPAPCRRSTSTRRADARPTIPIRLGARRSTELGAARHGHQRHALHHQPRAARSSPCAWPGSPAARACLRYDPGRRTWRAVLTPADRRRRRRGDPPPASGSPTQAVLRPGVAVAVVELSRTRRAAWSRRRAVPAGRAHRAARSTRSTGGGTPCGRASCGAG